ncbi:hypothetical protein AAHD62_15005 [Enterobacter hormaechei]
MRNIDKQALREKFERWWEVNYHNGKPPRFGWDAWREEGGYKIDDDEPELDGMWNAWQAATSAIEDKCAALAAKGMELAAEAAVVYGKYNETQMPDRDLVDMQTIQEMHDLCSGVKNADAFLDEVRVQGVAMFASKCKEESKRASSSDYRDSWWVSGENAEDFAAQLRQGGAV